MRDGDDVATTGDQVVTVEPGSFHKIRFDRHKGFGFVANLPGDAGVELFVGNQITEEPRS